MVSYTVVPNENEVIVHADSERSREAAIRILKMSDVKMDGLLLEETEAPNKTWVATISFVNGFETWLARDYMSEIEHL